VDVRVPILPSQFVDVAALVTTAVYDLEVRAERERASMAGRLLAPTADLVLVVRVLPFTRNRV
jgi:hypothetical protein